MTDGYIPDVCQQEKHVCSSGTPHVEGYLQGGVVYVPPY